MPLHNTTRALRHGLGDHTHVLCLLLVCTLCSAVGCAVSTPPPGQTPSTTPTPNPPPTDHPDPRSGTLFIAGGGSGAGGALDSAFLALAGSDDGQRGEVLVIPTASGVPAESGESAAADFRAVATRHEIGVLTLDARDPAAADDPLLAELVRHADGLWFTGGDQSRIVDVFRPPATQGNARATGAPGAPEGPSLVDTALRAMLADGGVVGGASAGAAVMSDPMITGGRSEQALLVGVAGGGVGVGPGMGLYPFGLLDQHFFERGRLGRLIVALEHTGETWGAGIEEGAAVVVTLGESPRLTALVPDSALLVDMTDATRDDRGNRGGIRLSLLGTGDTWAPLTGTVTPEPQRRAGGVSRVEAPAGPATTEPDAWAPGAVRDAIHALAADPDHPRVLRSRAFTLTFSADPMTGFYVRPDHRHDVCAVGVLLEIARR